MKMLKHPILGRLNQGVVFTSAKAERYPRCDVSGIIVTARCDIEQDKFNVLNYVPVVRLSDWLAVDGYDICLNRAAADLQGRIRRALKSLELPDSLLLSQSLTSIFEIVVRDPEASRSTRKAEPTFIELIRIEAIIDRCLTGTARSNPDFYEQFESFGRSLIKELINHRLTGYYYLPAIDANSEQEGFVALLREVTYLPRSLVGLIANGVGPDDGKLEAFPNWAAYLDFEASPFAMPIGELISPHIEHLLQTFSYLFGRIGLPDHDEGTIERMCNVKPELEQR
ncbi:hypothetical protein IVB33_17240 [Bradyrhizobium sp. 24]|nr:hypothetical protein [Bradyrhizobium sp. 24]